MILTPVQTGIQIEITEGVSDVCPKRVLVVGSDPAARAILRDAVGAQTGCDEVTSVAEVGEEIARRAYALVVADAAGGGEGIRDVIAAVKRVRKQERPLLFVIFDPSSTLPRQLDPRVVTMMVRRPFDEVLLREVLAQTVSRLLAFGGEITLRRLKESGALGSAPTRKEEQRALVVEDERTVRELSATILRRANVECDTAPEGKTAIEMLTARHYRVIVLDLMMPLMSGWEVIGWMRANPEHKPRSVIVCTAADRSTISGLDPEIVNAILLKPFDANELASYVRACMGLPYPRDRRRTRLIGEKH